MLILLSVFTVRCAEAKEDPCAQFSNQDEQKICYSINQDLTAYGDELVKKNSMPMYSASITIQAQTIQPPPETIQERSIPIQQQEKAGQEGSGFSAETQRRNIFE